MSHSMEQHTDDFEVRELCFCDEKAKRDETKELCPDCLKHVPVIKDCEIHRQVPMQEIKKKRGDCCEECFKWGEQYGQYVFPCNNSYCFCHVPKTKEL